MATIIAIEDDDLSPVKEAAGERVQMLVFSATWCGPCKAMAPSVDDIARAYSDEVTVAKIDIDKSRGLAQEYSIRGVPSIVLRRGDDIIERHYGTLTRTRLSQMLDNAIEGASA